MRTMKCKHCGGETEISKDKTKIYCPYCGNSELIEESDAVKIQQIKSQTEKDLELTRLKNEQEKESKQESKEELKSFKKGLLSKLLIIFTIISALVCAVNLSSGISLTGIIALIQAVLYLAAWLMGMQVVKSKGKKYLLLTVIALILNIPFFMSLNDSSSVNKAEEFIWTDIELHEIVPETNSNIGEIMSNREDYLHIYVHNTSDIEYKEYIEDCKSMTFNIESKNFGNNYTAYNENGYEIRLWYNETDDELSITVEAPREMSDIKWPTLGPATMLPIPSSLYGSISYDNSNQFIVYIGNISIEDYSNYVENCINKGFSNDYSRSDEHYSATNDEGYTLKINYVGFNTIEISIKAPEKMSENDTSVEDSIIDSEDDSEVDNDAVNNNEKTENDTEASDNNEDKDSIFDAFGVTPEFKEAMDSYEEFFDEYIAFMEKYENSNYSVDLLNDYNNYMAQYAETMDEFEDIANQDLSIFDSAYYLKVQASISKKLLDLD